VENAAFVGEERHAAVQGLVDLFQIGLINGPTTVLLSSPAGWGKTRIVHEFYARIAAQQSQPYWPPTVVPVDEESVLRRRKRTHPAFVDVSPDAVIPWMWWGVEGATRGDGTHAPTFRPDDPQWFMHARSIHQTLSRMQRAYDVSKAVGKRVPVVASVLGCFYLPVSIAGAAHAVVAEMWRDGRRLAAVHEGVDESAMFGEALRPKALAKAVGRLCTRLGPSTPLCIFVEDAHFLDADGLAFLTALRDFRKAPVLVVLSSQSDVLAEQATAGSFELGAALKCGAFQVDQHVTLQPLTDVELESGLLTRFPASDRRVTRAVATRFAPNPLALELALDTPIISAVRGQPLNATVADVSAMPNSVSDLLGVKWAQLPREVRRALVLGAMIGPGFDRITLNNIALTALGDELAGPVEAALQQHQWLRSGASDPHVGRLEFSEHALYELALGHQGDALSGMERDAIERAAAEIVRETVATSPERTSPDDALVNIARCVLRRIARGGSANAIAVGDAAGVLAKAGASAQNRAALFRLQADAYERARRPAEHIARALWRASSASTYFEPRAAIELAEQAFAKVPNASTTDLLRDIIESRGLARCTAGDIAAGLDDLAHALELAREAEAAEASPAASAQVDRMLSNLASALVQAGRIDAALAANSEAYERRRSRLGESSFMTIVSLRNVARCFAHIEHWVDAIQRLLQVRRLFEELLGPADDETIEATAELGRMLRNMGCAEDSRSYLENAAKAADAELGTSAILALKTHLSIAHDYLLERRWAEAEGEFQYVLELARREWPQVSFLTAEALEGLSVIESNKPEPNHAEAFRTEACERWFRAEGPAGSRYLKARLMLAQQLVFSDRAGAAFDMVNNDIAAAERSRAEDDPIILALRVQQAATCLILAPELFDELADKVLNDLAQRGFVIPLHAALMAFGKHAVMAQDLPRADQFFLAAERLAAEHLGQGHQFSQMSRLYTGLFEEPA